MNKLITIDGPAASGKSSVSRLLAKKLSWPWVSTGAFYRGLAFATQKKGFSKEQKEEILNLVTDPVWKVQMTPEHTEVWFDGENVTELIGGEEVGAMASQISQIPEVREALLQRQRNCFDPEVGLIAEGRDCGTVVFPQAQLKVYLTASAAQRALRRSGEESADLDKTMEMQNVRDREDSQRKSAPLKVAEGGIKIDSSFLSLDEVVAQVFALYQTK